MDYFHHGIFTAEFLPLKSEYASLGLILLVMKIVAIALWVTMESKYASLGLILLVMKIVAIALWVTMESKIKADMQGKIVVGLKSHFKDDTTTKSNFLSNAWKYIAYELDCCGVNPVNNTINDFDPTDWCTISGRCRATISQIPKTCCLNVDENTYSTAPSDFYARVNKETYKTKDIDVEESGNFLTINEEIATEKQWGSETYYYPSHGFKLFINTVILFLFFVHCAGGTVLGNSLVERQNLSEIYQLSLTEVLNCPNVDNFNQRANNTCFKVCRSYLQDGNCAYHCMRDSTKTKLVEFCAKQKLLFKYCPEYDPVDKTIQKDEDTLCNSNSTRIYFNSSDIFFCDPDECLQLHEPSVRTGATTLTTLITKPFVMNCGNSQNTLFTDMLVLAVMILCM